MESNARYVNRGTRFWSHKSVLALLDQVDATADPEDRIRNRARELVTKALDMRWSGPRRVKKLIRRDGRGMARCQQTVKVTGAV